MDDDMANKIMSDGKFVNSLDYADENAELLARKKMKSEVLKKAFAVNGQSPSHFTAHPSTSLLTLDLDRLRKNEESSRFVRSFPILPPRRHISLAEG